MNISLALPPLTSAIDDFYFAYLRGLGLIRIYAFSCVRCSSAPCYRKHPDAHFGIVLVAGRHEVKIRGHQRRATGATDIDLLPLCVSLRDAATSSMPSNARRM